MATASDIMKGGFSAGQAKAVQGQAVSGLTAAGSTQGTALALAASLNIIGTAAASTGVRLQSCEIGDSVEIYNGGANAVTVYPDTGSQINSLSANAGVSLGTNTGIVLRRVTSTRWVGYLSA